MKTLIFVFCLFFSLTGLCQHSEKINETYKGTIAGQSVVLTFTGVTYYPKGSEKTGSYYYVSQGHHKRITVKAAFVYNATSAKDGPQIVFYELNTSGENQAQFEVSKSNENLMNGTWHNLKTGQEFPFTLQK